MRFSEIEWRYLKDIPRSEDLYWSPRPNFNSYMYSAHSNGQVYLKYISTEQVAFSCMFNAFPYCCGAFTISAISSSLSDKDTLLVAQSMLASIGDRLVLYVEAPNVGGAADAVLKAFGQMILPFGNPFHQNCELRLWALSSNLPKILTSYVKGTFT